MQLSVNCSDRLGQKCRLFIFQFKVLQVKEKFWNSLPTERSLLLDIDRIGDRCELELSDKLVFRDELGSSFEELMAGVTVKSQEVLWVTEAGEEWQVEQFLQEVLEKFGVVGEWVGELTETKRVLEVELPERLIGRRENYRQALELLGRGVSQVLVFEDLLSDLIEGKKLRVKHGVDPTTRDLHLGYAVNYEKMRRFQELGHQIVFLIGSFTARFGDPTDKNETRQMKDKESIVEMSQNYLAQLSRILDISKVEVRYNGDWYDGMSAEDLLRLMSEATVARMLERDMFTKRMQEGKEIGLHEIVYPLLQGYDSVEIEADVTVIGTDQTFNELQARPLQSGRGQSPQNIIAMNLLVGTDGKQKMSQSLGNYVGFDDSPEEKFGKIMSIPDSCMLDYWTAVTRISMTELKEIEEMLRDPAVNPRDLKLRLAREIVTIYDGASAAESAEQHFLSVFQKKEVPTDMPKYRLVQANEALGDILMQLKMVTSKSEFRRLVEQGGVSVNSEKIVDLEYVVQGGEIVKVGKRKFLKII